MAAPTYLVGTANGGSTGTEPHAITPPTHQADDWLYLVIESAPTNVVTVTAGAGGETWTQETDSPQQSSTNLDPGTRLTVYKHKATGSSVSAPTISNLTNHGWGVIVRVRGADTTNPVVDTNGAGVGTASTSITCGGVDTTGFNECLVLVFLAWGRDNAGPLMSSEANADLANFAEIHDLGTIAANGGGIAIWAGDKATGGSVGNTTATSSQSVEYAWLTVALKPPAVGGASNAPRAMYNYRRRRAA